jgi:hypothetical protein
MDRVIAALLSFDFYVGWLPAWEISLVVDVVAILLALLVHSVFFKWIERWVARQDLFRRSLVSRGQEPYASGGGHGRACNRLKLRAPVGREIHPQADDRRHRHLDRLDRHDRAPCMHRSLSPPLQARFGRQSMARKHITQSRILERVARVLIIILTLGVALMTFHNVRQYGVSLLA